MHQEIRRLPDSELEIMQAVWDCTPPVSKTDIETKVYPYHQMAETTLLTLLSRLTDKGFLSVEIRKRKKYYTPCISRKEYLAVQSKSFFNRVCGGNLSVFANALCDSGLTKEELAQLRTLLERDAL